MSWLDSFHIHLQGATPMHSVKLWYEHYRAFVSVAHINLECRNIYSLLERKVLQRNTVVLYRLKTLFFNT